MVALNKQVSITILLVIVLIAAITVLLIWEYQYQNNQKTMTDNNSPKTGALVLENSESRNLISPNSKMKVRRNICESPACITLAHQMQNWMDPSVDPCVDFFKYSCGNYVQHMNTLGNHLAIKLQSLIRMMDDFFHKFPKKSSSSESGSGSKSEEAMYHFHKKCEDIKHQSAFSQDFSKTLDDLKLDIAKIGSWPMVDQNFDHSKFDINEYLKNMAKLSLTDFGLFQMEPIEKFLRIDVEKNRAGSNKFSKVLKFLSSHYFKHHGINVDGNVKEDLEKVAGFAERLKEKSVVEKRMVKFSGVKSNFSLIKFEEIFKNWEGSLENWEKIESRIWFRYTPFFFNKTYNIENLIKETPPRTIANFLILNSINEMLDGIFTDVNEVSRLNCVGYVAGKFPFSSLRIFVRYYFDKRNLKAVDEMTENIREAYIQYFNESTKLDDETRNEAIKKVKMIKKTIGYPEELEQQDFGEKYFEKILLNQADSFYTMHLRLKSSHLHQILDYSIDKLSANPTSFFLEVNAQYIANYNSFQIFVPYMDEPIFDISHPASSKYGLLGFTIAHEMGHGFDQTGRLRDENGTFRDWWNEDALNEYNKGMDCLKKQYEEYDDPDHGKNLKANLVIREIIADLLGEEVAYQAYRNLKLAHEQHIPGMEGVDGDKMFFRTHATALCQVRDKMSLERVQTRSSHPTNSFRANGIFSNSKHFAKAFNCPVGSPMNPKDKCELF